MVEEKQLSTGVSDKETPEVSIASSLIPYPFDDNKRRFLGYRACGFSPREAVNMLGIGMSAVSYWRTSDPLFVQLELQLPEIRKQLSKEYIELEFLRNFRLVLEKDYRVVKRSLSKEYVEVPRVGGGTRKEEVPMPAQDHDYLLKMRGYYNMQQMQMLEAVIGNAAGGFDFAKWVADNPDAMQFSRTDTVTMVRKNG